MWPLVLKTWRLAVLSVKEWTKTKLTNAGGMARMEEMLLGIHNQLPLRVYS